MKRLLACIIAASCVPAVFFAEPNPLIDGLFDPLKEDLSALAGSICDDAAPELIQPLLGGDMVGAAALDGDFPHGTVIIPAVSLSLGNGFATALNDGARDWKFKTTPIPNMIKTALAGDSSAMGYYNATRTMFPYPAISGGLGFGVAKDFEVFVSGMYLPQVLTDAIIKTANSSTISGLNPQFSTGGVVVKARKVFFRDSKAWPAMSVGLGTAFGGSTIGATIDLKTLMGKEFDISGVGTLNLAGPVSFNAQTFGVGMDFAVSKQFFVFVPFARTAVWYKHSTVSSNFDLTAKITTTTTTTEKKLSFSPSASKDSIAGRIGGGMEFRFKPVIFHVSADLDLENPLVNIAGTEYEGLTLKTGFRFAF